MSSWPSAASCPAQQRTQRSGGADCVFRRRDRRRNLQGEPKKIRARFFLPYLLVCTHIVPYLGTIIIIL